MWNHIFRVHNRVAYSPDEYLMLTWEWNSEHCLISCIETQKKFQQKNISLKKKKKSTNISGQFQNANAKELLVFCS